MTQHDAAVGDDTLSGRISGKRMMAMESLLGKGGVSSGEREGPSVLLSLGKNDFSVLKTRDVCL